MDLHIVQVARQIFDKFDKNKDGSVEKSELKPLLSTISKQLNLPDPTDEDIENGLKELDLNKNGKLEFEEFYPFYKQVYDSLKGN
jgi:Ca2+-binding EF-hand superfamily protein